MTEIVSIRFKTCGKNYSFSPEGITVKAGDKVIVETAKGIELAECTRGNRMVEDTSVVQPLRPVIRVATEQDLKTAEQNKLREKEAFSICQKKIEAHGLDMKLVDVELSFDGSKTLFFFTSDGRVDFRDLVKDLAGIFHNRIELRQIGVRDEAKMIGGIGICGRPYCCNEFLSDFAPVSTKMAKVQNLSLNPAKISGSCGRLMCCLRYEEEAYEDLVKTVPKVGAFVESVDGYGVATSVDLLRQTVTVHLDGEADDAVHVFKAAEVATVPGGRPKDGEPYPKVLSYVPEEETPEESEDLWASPDLFAVSQSTVSAPVAPEAESAAAAEDASRTGSRGRDRRRSGSRHGKKPEVREAKADSDKAKPDTAKDAKDAKPAKKQEGEKPAAGEAASQQKKNSRNNRFRRGHGSKKPAGDGAPKTEKAAVPQAKAPSQPKDSSKSPKAAKGPAPAGDGKNTSGGAASASGSEGAAKKKNNRRRYYSHKGNKPSGGAPKAE